MILPSPLTLAIEKRFGLSDINFLPICNLNVTTQVGIVNSRGEKGAGARMVLHPTFAHAFMLWIYEHIK